ncbi:MAG TPA: hypothetical protein VGY98_09490 [Verrucomicrobiae bacterium]|nr:hypothetical protein [Verrucomicrobiae bacterium]
MDLTNCPMCSGSLENATTKTCGTCGADLTRWMRVMPAPPLVPVTAEQVQMEIEAKPAGEFSLGLGVAGAVGGALMGMGVMYGFYVATGVRFPLLGVGTGLLTGFGARWLFKGTDHTLGIICAGAAMLGVLGALVMIYGIDFSPLNIVSVVVSASVAYKIATR